MVNAPQGATSTGLRVLKQRLLRISTGLIVLWLLALWYGERKIFQSSVAQCQWHNWQQWGEGSQPHNILLIADPQLVDPHTYPGRPWPLSSLTIRFSDLYLRRCYYYLQNTLRPDSTLFLGDLFDGGREWGAAETAPSYAQFKRYDNQYWLKEYARFSGIFMRDWTHGPLSTTSAPMGRRLISSVPGNHDLGFASGIQPAVRDRFDAFFGPLNRIDIMGNHSIVQLDSVSLSAMDQVDPKTGSSGTGDGSTTAANSHLWRPVEDYLVSAKEIRNRAVQREWQRLTNQPPHNLLSTPELVSLKNSALPAGSPNTPSIPSSQFPTILLTHVPLFRPANTPCGPLREGSPSLTLGFGYQFQNVLTSTISSDIIKHLRPEEVIMIYSGDDHDYCEVDHNEFTGRIKEITVKSMSLAMGVRRPGVQLVSLWNPIDPSKIASADGKDPGTPRDTVQNHLCLLPDQLGILLGYAQLLALTLIILAIAAIRSDPDASDKDHRSSTPLLPLATKHQHPDGWDQSAPHHHSDSHTSSASAAAAINNLTTRNGRLGAYGNITTSSRSSSPSKPLPATVPVTVNGYTALTATAKKDDDYDDDDWGTYTSESDRRRAQRTRLGVFFTSVCDVAWPSLLFYAWLLWNG